MGFSRQEYWSGVPLPSLTQHFYMLIKIREFSGFLSPPLTGIRNFILILFKGLYIEREEEEMLGIQKPTHVFPVPLRITLHTHTNKVLIRFFKWQGLNIC